MKIFNNNKKDKAHKKFEEDIELLHKAINGVDGHRFMWQEELQAEEKKRATKPKSKRWWSRKVGKI